MNAVLPYLLAVVLLWAAYAAVASVVEAVRVSHRPSEPGDGCCGCGAGVADVVVAPDDKGRGEGYCWECIDTWPADGEPLAEIGVHVFPGHERTAR